MRDHCINPIASASLASKEHHAGAVTPREANDSVGQRALFRRWSQGGKGGLGSVPALRDTRLLEHLARSGKCLPCVFQPTI